ncbi:MAG: hypothetical protein QXI60_06825, partial [Thermofilaceae archaeon]
RSREKCEQQAPPHGTSAEPPLINPTQSRLAGALQARYSPESFHPGSSSRKTPQGKDRESVKGCEPVALGWRNFSASPSRGVERGTVDSGL